MKKKLPVLIFLCVLLLLQALPLRISAAGTSAADLRLVLTSDNAVSLENNAETVLDYEGEDSVVFSGIDSKITFEAQLSKAGKYYISVKYLNGESRSGTALRKLSINGVYQSKGAQEIPFPRVYKDAGEKTIDVYGNEVRPSQTEAKVWQERILSDYMGYDQLLTFDLAEGKNLLCFEYEDGTMSIANVTLIEAESLSLPYAKIQKSYTELQNYAGDEIRIEGESAQYKSSPTLYPLYDSSSMSTSPYRDGKVTLNMIGGWSFSSPNQFLSWEFEVPEDGLYNIGIKYRQSMVRGMISTRTVYIDNELPASEFAAVGFRYGLNWQTQILGENAPYAIYLTKGSHTIKMECVLGDMGPLIGRVTDCLASVNRIYRSIIVITGTNPDVNRDYKLPALIPSAIDEMLAVSVALRDVYAELQALSGQAGPDTVIIQTLANQLERLNRKPEEIAKTLNYFKSNLGALGSWVSDARDQPLEIDYISLLAPGDSMPRANDRFFSSLLFAFKSFIASFFTDYDSVGQLEETESDTLKVWIGTGRDQAQILRSLTFDDFSAKSGIKAKIDLVNNATLLPAVLANKGPDISVFLGESEPVNYASRGALLDLTRFPDFWEVEKQFCENAARPFTYNGGVYALSEQMDFKVMFYRKDILDELELDIPKTWNDVIAMSKTLAKNNMSFALPFSDLKNPGLGLQNLYTFILQNGGSLFSDDLSTCLIDNDIGTKAFVQWTNFYINYNMPLAYDFGTRFRTGEVPIAVADYTGFNSILLSAPEIRGLWNFAPMPGTLQEDGSIDNTSTLYLSACVILKKTKNPENAWDFLKWWTSAATQERFGKEMESIVGPAARYNPANLETFANLSWTNEQYKVLKEQLDNNETLPQVVGNYALIRNLDTAFRKVVLNNKDQKDTLTDYVANINRELEKKRLELSQ